MAAAHNHAVAVRALLGLGADAAAEDATGSRPHDLAAVGLHLEALQVLLKEGGAAAQVAAQGSAAVARALRVGSTGEAGLLLAPGAARSEGHSGLEVAPWSLVPWLG